MYGLQQPYSSKQLLFNMHVRHSVSQPRISVLLVLPCTIHSQWITSHIYGGYRLITWGLLVCRLTRSIWRNSLLEVGGRALRLGIFRIRLRRAHLQHEHHPGKSSMSKVFSGLSLALSYSYQVIFPFMCIFICMQFFMCARARACVRVCVGGV